MVRSQRSQVVDFVSEHQWDILLKQKIQEPAATWCASDRSVCKYLPFGIGCMALANANTLSEAKEPLTLELLAKSHAKSEWSIGCLAGSSWVWLKKRVSPINVAFSLGGLPHFHEIKASAFARDTGIRKLGRRHPAKWRLDVSICQSPSLNSPRI